MQHAFDLTQEQTSLVLEVLKRMRGAMSRLEDGQRQCNERLISLDHHVAGLHQGQLSTTDALTMLEARVCRIELRLGLAEAPTNDSGRNDLPG